VAQRPHEAVGAGLASFAQDGAGDASTQGLTALEPARSRDHNKMIQARCSERDGLPRSASDVLPPNTENGPAARSRIRTK